MISRPFRFVRGSIRAKLALLIGTVAALVVITLCGIQAWFNSQRLWDSANLELVRTTGLVTALVESTVGNTMDEMSVLSADPNVVEDFRVSNTVEMSRRLAAWRGHDPDLLNVIALDRDGVIFATSQDDETSLLGLNRGDEAEVQAALLEGRPGVGEPRPGAISGKPTVPVAAAVRDEDGQIIGVLLAGLSLDQLSSYMDRVAVGKSGYASLLTRDGVILTNPNRQRILTRAAGANQAVIAAREGRTTTVQTVNASGDPIIAAGAPIPLVGWVVQAQLARGEALAPIYAEIGRGALIGIEMLLAALLVSGAAATYATTSIARLREASERWARGDLSHQADLTSADELGELGRSFNQMAAELQDTLRRNEALLVEVDGERATLSRVMEGMSDGLVGLDEGQCVRFFNGRASEMLGIDLGSLIGRPLVEGLQKARHLYLDPTAAMAVYQRLLADVDERPIVELTIAGPPRLDLSLQTFPVTGTEGQAVGLLVRDVTAERDLARTKDELVSVVSHELRAPLASLTGFTELMLTRDFTKEQRTKFLITMLGEGNRLTALINDFLDMQRMEIGRQPLRVEPTDLLQLVNHSLMAAGIDDAHPVVLDLPSTLAEVPVDPARVQQVLTNLISNARKYSPNGGDIRVSVRQIGGAVEVTVTDHGLGLPSEAQSGLFQKFYRVDSRDRREIKGTGLGLAICKQIIEAHGGFIWATSPGVGKGSVFGFTLPTETSVVAGASA